jgi:hypothetical protein
MRWACWVLVPGEEVRQIQRDIQELKPGELGPAVSALVVLAQGEQVREEPVPVVLAQEEQVREVLEPGELEPGVQVPEVLVREVQLEEVRQIQRDSQELKLEE